MKYLKSFSLITEKRSDKLSLDLSRLVIKKFNRGENFEVEQIAYERGFEIAYFDFTCKFRRNDDMNQPFTISAAADAVSMELAITYNGNYFPQCMNDFVAEVKETIEHELEHVEQDNFKDKKILTRKPKGDVTFVKYLTSKVEVPAYVRGLKKRAKTKRISLNQAMDEWFSENKENFKDPDVEWPIVKDTWLKFALNMGYTI